MLILRIALGITALFRGADYLTRTNDSTAVNSIIALSLMLAGLLFLVGFLTTIIGVIFFTGSFIVVILFAATNQNAAVFIPEIYAIVLAAAISFLGPGAFSLDAYFFGRREIIIPKKSSTANK